MQRERGNKREGEAGERGANCAKSTLPLHGSAPRVSGCDSTPDRKENVEDASRTEPKGGDEESDEAWQAIRCDDATYQCEEEDGRCEEEERRSPASLIEVPEPWDQERKDSRREG